MFKKYLILYFSIFSLTVNAQKDTASKIYPQNYFSYPLKIAPAIAGSFGELRSNHFHSGLDFRTNQQEGYPVYAPADGYVSRLRIQIGGGGNHIYIVHPNGYTTVYMHLQRFNDRISKIIRAYQTKKERFDVDFPLLPIEISIKKGEIIAWSGNTGGSAGPHLHFEIRDTKTEETINPQLFGITIPDAVKPTISEMYMYRLNGKPFSEKTPKHYFQVLGSNGNYLINKSPVIKFNGQVGFGIITTDRNSASPNQNGVYCIELLLDGEIIYSAEWERFAFSNSRAINSHIDYATHILTGKRIQKSFIAPGNPLRIYNREVNKGIISISDTRIHQLQYNVIDVAGNVSTLSFRIQYDNTASIPQKETPATAKFFFNQDNSFNTDNVKLMIPKGNLYDDLDFQYAVTDKLPGTYSQVHHIQSRLTPVHDFWNLWIKPDSTLREDLRKKALIVDQRGIPQGGFYEDGYIKAKPRIFGNFYIKTDTIAPVIIPVNISPGRSMVGQSSIRLKIADNLSGISMFKAYIDQKWVLMEYNYKTGLVWYTFEPGISNGKHHFSLEVTDDKMNKKVYEAEFFR